MSAVDNFGVSFDNHPHSHTPQIPLPPTHIPTLPTQPTHRQSHTPTHPGPPTHPPINQGTEPTAAIEWQKGQFRTHKKTLSPRPPPPNESKKSKKNQKNKPKNQKTPSESKNPKNKHDKSKSQHHWCFSFFWFLDSQVFFGFFWFFLEFLDSLGGSRT